MASLLRSKLIWLLFVLVIFSSEAFAQTTANQALHIPLYASKVSMDPTGVQDQSSLWVSRQVNCQLLRFKSGKPEMEAASQVKYLDPTRIQVTIRDDVTFYDGSPVTSQDVITTFRHLGVHRRLFRSIFNWVKDIEKKDDKNLVFLLQKPFPQFLDVLSAPNYPIYKSDFIAAIEKNPSLWTQPIGCGEYQIQNLPDSSDTIKLVPRNPSFKPIAFHLIPDNQIPSDEIEKYDIISLPIVGEKKQLDQFRVEKIFDPYHVFIGLNTNLPEWQKKENRCELFSHLRRDKILKTYGDTADPANDVYPRGILGYNRNKNLPPPSDKPYQPPKDHFCLGVLSVSIPRNYRDSYKSEFEDLFGHVETMTFDNPKKFGKNFQESKCDALTLGLKSNTLDAYEYIITLSEKDANFTGYWNPAIIANIKKSQDSSDRAEKAEIYREISDQITETCLYYPVLTIPMKTIFVKKDLQTPGMGTVPLNEYFLGQVQ